MSKNLREPKAAPEGVLRQAPERWRPVNGALRPSETRVLVHLVRGATNAEIAARTGLTEQTVKSYVSDIYLKLGVRCRAEAVMVALRTWPQLRDAAPPEGPPAGDGSAVRAGRGIDGRVEP